MVNEGPSSPPQIIAVAPPPSAPYAYPAPPPQGYAPSPYGQPGQPAPPPQPIMMMPTIAPMVAPIVVPLGSINGQDPLLEGLLAFPGLILKQDIRDLCTEMYCRWAQANSYSIFNPAFGDGWHKQQILHVKENSSCIERFCCRSSRGLNLAVLTADDREVISIDRPYHLCSKGGCFCYCSDSFYQIIDVHAGRDTHFAHTRLGRVRQNFSFFKPYLTIFNSEGEEVYRILASCCTCGSRSFRIFRAHEGEMEKKNQIGIIKKKWGGFTREFLTNCDTFAISFPVDSNHVQRALIIAASLFIDYLYYENSQTEAQQLADS